MNICIFDTETISLEKPFCYNVGYIIVNTETEEKLLKREFVVEQIWSNTELFATAHYAEKRPLYVKRLKGRTVRMEKWGYITQQMIRDFKSFEVVMAYAYNSKFDEKVFTFNCEWYKTINPFENVPIYDIRGYVHHFVAFDKDFQEWCEREQQFTESGNYSTTAETLFRYVVEDTTFEEEHTALADSEIEYDILQYCVDLGAEWGKVYKIYATIPRAVDRELVVVQNGEEHSYTYRKRLNKGNKIYLT